MCRLLQVSVSGFYAWCNRAVSLRRQTDRELARKIREIHRRSHGTYGAPRIHAELALLHDIHVGRKRVARLMRAEQLRGITPKRWVPTTTQDPQAGFARDLVNRNFRATAPDRLWVGDITYIPAGRRNLYLAVVIDAWSRKVVGWSMAAAMPSGLVVAALNMALVQRHPRSVIHHSDRGVQYTSMLFMHRCKEAHIRVSMGSTGDAYDNALCESFFATLKRELLLEHRFSTPTEARRAVFHYIEGWYNPHRRHSALSYVAPIDFERSTIKRRVV
jgi:putative transposase